MLIVLGNKDHLVMVFLWELKLANLFINCRKQEANEMVPQEEIVVPCTMGSSDHFYKQAIWHYSPNRAPGFPSFHLQSSLLSAISFQFLIPRNWFTSFLTASSHLFMVILAFVYAYICILWSRILLHVRSILQS